MRLLNKIFDKLNWQKRRKLENTLNVNHSKDKVFTKIRTASTARIGGFRPLKTFAKSRISGDFVMKIDEEWPNKDGRYFDPIIQINLFEVAFIPKSISRYKLITVFVDLEQFDKTHDLKGNYEIRAYESLENLQTKKAPLSDKLKTFEIEWIDCDDYPSLEDNIWLNGGPEEFFKVGVLNVNLEEEVNQVSTKFGGWPTLIQHELDMQNDKFLFQIASENKCLLNWVDGGYVYVGYENGKWILENQFY